MQQAVAVTYTKITNRSKTLTTQRYEKKQKA